MKPVKIDLKKLEEKSKRPDELIENLQEAKKGCKGKRIFPNTFVASGKKE